MLTRLNAVLAKGASVPVFLFLLTTEKKRAKRMSDLMVDLSEVSLTLVGGGGKVNILKSIDFKALRGESIGVTGPSGSGKTSMLMVMSGLEKATNGKISVAGKDLTLLGEDSLARFRAKNIGIVFQSFHLLPIMTALENVALPLEFSAKPDSRSIAADALKSVGLGDRMSHYPSQLSGGELQRVALARAFVSNPALLLADEPTGNLDMATGSQVMDLLFEMQEKNGTTLILVTHDPRLAQRCGRCVKMLDGRLFDEKDGRPCE